MEREENLCLHRKKMWMYVLLTVILFAAAAIFGGKISPYVGTTVQAAENVVRVDFTDNSGRYLEKKGTKWYIFDQDSQPLTGIQLLSVPKGCGIDSGYYMFDKGGILHQKKGILHFKKQKIGNVTFEGYHYVSSTGRFQKDAAGLVYLKNVSCQGKTFNGVYYIGSHGRMTNTPQIRRVSAKKVGNITFYTAYYYFDKDGKVSTVNGFHSLNQVLGGHKYKGTYYFGYKNGALYKKAGWITISNNKYYLSSYGRRYQNCWKDGYYLLSNGKIAKNCQVPDGSYVDCDGRKCAKEEMKLSALKKQLKKMTDSYGGTWSVYVKDLKTGNVVNLNEQAMYPASVIKAFVMASTFDQIRQKKLSYNSTVKNLLKEMITVSDNEAYNQLVRMNSTSRSFVKGAATVNAYLKKNGYTKTQCHTTLHPAYSSFTSDGLGSNRSSAKDCGLLLEKIYKGTCVSSKYSKEMLNLLKKQTRKWKIPSGLPSGIVSANKTGETSTVQHDMAIVYGKKTTYVICVFSSNIGEYYGINGIRNISRYVYNYLN